MKMHSNRSIMAADRIPRGIAEETPFPPHTWFRRSIYFMLEANKENIKKVPINEKLMEDLSTRKMVNPILVTPTWWPIAGQQRMRCLMELKQDYEIQVCRLDQAWWTHLFYWNGEPEAKRLVAIWFQTLETVFKSRYYTDNSDQMIEYELIGDTLTWTHKK